MKILKIVWSASIPINDNSAYFNEKIKNLLHERKG